MITMKRKLTAPVIAGSLMALLIGSNSFGADLTVKTPSAALKTRLNQSAPPKQSPWSASLLSFAEFHRVPKKSGHYSELKLGYSFNRFVSVGFLESYSGPFAKEKSAEADFGDPQFGLDAKAPLITDPSIGKISLMAGTALILPASKYARDSDMTAGWTLNGGLGREGSLLSVRQMNTVYLYSYRGGNFSGSSRPATTESDSWFGTEGEESSVNAEEAPADDRTYWATEHSLESVFNLTSVLFWKTDFTYFTGLAGNERYEAAKFVTRFNYDLTSHLRLIAGVVSQAELNQEPRLFSEKTWAGRLGMYIKL